MYMTYFTAIFYNINNINQSQQPVVDISHHTIFFLDVSSTNQLNKQQLLLAIH
jgi:hypothetical protein